MRLHVAPRTRAVRAHWLIEEVGLPHEVVRLPEASAAALAPLEELPVLEVGGLRLAGSLPVLLFLGDLPEAAGLVPAPASPLRGEYLQWLVFSETTLDGVVTAHLPGGTPPAPSRVAAVLDVVEARVAGRETAVGPELTVVDLSLTSVLHLAHQLGLLTGRPALETYLMRHAGRPAVRRALGR